MKTETLKERKERTGKEPKKLKIDESNTFSFRWITKGHIKLKKKKSPVERL